MITEANASQVNLPIRKPKRRPSGQERVQVRETETCDRSSLDKRLTYAEKLRDPRWLEVRYRVLERDCHKCRHCGSGGTLHVHHAVYADSGNPWDVSDAVLYSLCPNCHERLELILKKVRLLMSDRGRPFVDAIEAATLGLDNPGDEELERHHAEELRLATIILGNSSLSKAYVDDFVYAVKLKSGQVITFGRVEILDKEWVRLIPVNGEFDHRERGGLPFPAPRGMDVRLADIEVAMDAPAGS